MTLRDLVSVAALPLVLLLAACGGTSNPTVEKKAPAESAEASPRLGPPRYEGVFETLDCSIIGGWAWDINDPMRPVSVDIHVDGRKVATNTVGLYRPDLLQSGKGDGKHGMHLYLPPELRDGKSHVVDVRYGGTDISLSGSPRTLQGGCKVPPKEAFLDRADCEAISGWAFDPVYADKPVSVSLFDNGREVLKVQADIYRPDLEKVGKGNGKHGFFAPTPASLKDGQTHKVSMTITGSNVPAGNSPLDVTCRR